MHRSRVPQHRNGTPSCRRWATSARNSTFTGAVHVPGARRACTRLEEPGLVAVAGDRGTARCTAAPSQSPKPKLPAAIGEQLPQADGGLARPPGRSFSITRTSCHEG